MLAHEAPVLLCSIDRAWRLLSVSDRWLHALGYERHEAVGRALTDFLTEGSRRLALDIGIPEFASGRECSNVPYQMLCRDGRVIDVLMSATAGSGEGSPAVLVDVTDSRRTAETRRPGRSAVPRPQHVIPLGHWLWTPSREAAWPTNGYSKYSTSAAGIFGVTPDELSLDDDSFCERFVHPDDRDRLRERLRRSLEPDQGGYTAEYRILRADGAVRTVHEVAEKVRREDGAISHIMGSVQDITDLLQAEQALLDSEERFRALADNSPMVIFLKDLAGRYLMVNREFEKNHGMTDADVRGKTAFDMFPHSEAEIYAAHDRLALDGRAAFRKEMAHEGPDGIRQLSVVKFPVFDSDGRLIGLGGLEFDITEIRRAEMAIRESEQRFRSIADMIPALIWMSDRNGDCVFVNKTWLDYTGRTLDCELGRGFADNIHPDDWQATIETEKQVFDRQEVFSVDYRLRGADLEYRWFLDTAAPRYSPEGEYLGYIGILVDVTERRRLESELMLAKEGAETANRTKTQFLANMSHELRTPLNAIIGFSEIMMKEMFGKVDSPHYLGYVGDINQSGRHLLEVINDILDLSKIEAGKLELHEESCDVPAILRSAIRLVRDRAAANRVHLVERMAPDLPALLADARAVKQIVLNLLSNAVKFTPADGTVVLAAQLTREGGMLINVSDTGIGISAEDLPRALEAFGQIDSSLGRRFEGTGLGLPLTKALADMHGAAFDLKSEPDVGTRVSITFPPARVDAHPDEETLARAFPMTAGRA